MRMGLGSTSMGQVKHREQRVRVIPPPRLGKTVVSHALGTGSLNETSDE